jgi:polyribonucleotide nucleotidyltransferase
MKKIEKSTEIGGKKLTLSSGDIAEQADAAVIAQYGETVVLATVVASSLEEDPGFLPLTVQYQERLYAGGRIKGSRWVKREGRPSDDEILTARLVDRSVRPLFPKDYRKDVQIIITILSVDLENPPDMVACVAASTALASSPIPWSGPVGTVRVGRMDKKFLTNPVENEMQSSEMDLVVAATKDAVIMIEAGANEVPEKDVLSGIEHGYKEAKTLIKFIEGFVKEAGKKKEGIKKAKKDLSLEKKVKDLAKKDLKEKISALSEKRISGDEFDEYKSAIFENFSEDGEKLIGSIFEDLVKQEVRKMVLSKKRPDGRKPDEIRELSAKVEILPRTHGSAIFQRGQTQVLTVTTLGPPSLEQFIESAEGEETKRYIHHYSMPPYSIGETGRFGYPSRREIGHGALAERALLPVIPSETDFPYTIRVVSEVLSSNGSTSMASTCGSTLSLMDAGVPISAPVAGIAMGLVIESEKKFEILTDITGLEDGYGDMDFKVAGTKEGITALQLDVKTLNLTPSMLKAALDQAKKARDKILEVIVKTIAKPRAKVSTHAPKIKLVKVPQDKIGEVIGPGGRVIRNIIAETGAQIDVEDDGTVNISGMTDEEVNKALEKVEALTKEISPGEIYEGVVKRIEPFGVFVEIAPGRDGMVHVSDMSIDYVKNPRDLVKIGDKVKVRVKEIDELGRINLSMLLDGDDEKKKDKGTGRKFNRKRKDRGSGRKRSSGPHFPASRFIDQKKKDFGR